MSFDWYISKNILTITSELYSLFIPILCFKNVMIAIIKGEDRKNKPIVRLIFKKGKPRDDYEYTFKGTSVNIEKLTDMVMDVYKELEKKEVENPISLI